MNMDGEQSVQTIGAIFLMHFASFSTKRTRQAYRMKPTKTLLHGKLSVLENFNGKSLLLHQKNLITVCAQ